MTKYTPEEILEHREMWVAALESGEYLQGSGALAYVTEAGGATRYCCLGVATKVSGLLSEEMPEFGVGSVMFVGEDERSNAVLPDEVAEWLGVTRNNPQVRWSSVVDRGQEDLFAATHLSVINDSYGRSFAEIARIIRTLGFVPQEDELAGALV